MVSLKVQQRLQLAFDDESPLRAIGFRWYSEFEKEQIWFGDEECFGRPSSSVTAGNIEKMKRMIDKDLRCAYQAMKTSLTVESPRVNSIDHLRLKKNVTHWVP